MDKMPRLASIVVMVIALVVEGLRFDPSIAPMFNVKPKFIGQITIIQTLL
jgi:hypothetical protein